MAFTAITSTEIETGKPVATTTQTKIKDNFDDHETRISSLEDGSAVAYPPIQLSVYGYYGDQGAATGWVKYITNFDITITGARLYIDTAGSANTTEIDIQVKAPGGSYQSIFTTKPSVVYSSGDDAVSSNQVLDPTKVDIPAGSILRLDTTAVQTNGKSFHVRIDYERG